MSFSLILSVLVALLKFPTELGAFIKLISKTPEEKRQEVMKAIQIESDAIDASGRPSWE